MRRTLHLAALRGVALIAACMSASGVAAQSRWVIVNGERLSDAQVARLARIQCTEIPNGAYWLNERSGAWGYAGNPQVQGHLGDLCRNGAPTARSRPWVGRTRRPTPTARAASTPTPSTTAMGTTCGCGDERPCAAARLRARKRGRLRIASSTV